MEFRTYQEMKAKGLATLVKNDKDSFSLLIKQFDPGTGLEAAPLSIYLTKEALTQAIALHQADLARVSAEVPLEIAGIQGVIAEMDSLS